jgi:hypothetical protein
MSDIVSDSPVGSGPYFEDDDPDAEERGVSFDSSVNGMTVASGSLASSSLCAFNPLYA